MHNAHFSASLICQGLVIVCLWFILATYQAGIVWLIQGRSTPFRGGRAGADTGFMKGGGGGGGGSSADLSKNLA